MGLFLLATLPIVLLWRVVAAVAWLLVNVRRLLIIAKGYKCCRRIRIVHNGSVTLQTADGCWVSATLIPGSVVLSKVAWLRFKAEDGQQFAELICEQNARNKSWRRLRVIWRHFGAGG